MTIARDMLQTTPSDVDLDLELLAAAIAACNDCVIACTACADACLGEEMVGDMRKCITTDLGCADICAAAVRILSRQTGYHQALTRTILEACLTACRECAEECEQHAEMHAHCARCAQACRDCEEACRRLLDNFAVAVAG